MAAVTFAKMPISHASLKPKLITLSFINGAPSPYRFPNGVEEESIGDDEKITLMYHKFLPRSN